jgi:hypothetical protein
MKFLKKHLAIFGISIVHKIGQRLHALFMEKQLWYIESNMKDVEKKWCKTKLKR